MNIGINAYEANVANRVGSNVYAFQILCELEKLCTNHSVRVFLPSAPMADLPPVRKGWTYVVAKPTQFWSLIGLPLHLYKEHVKQKFDVFYSLGHYGPRWSPCPTIVSIMDLAFLQFPTFFKSSDTYKLTAWTKMSVQKAAHIVAISQATKQDIMQRCGRKSADITVAYPSVELATSYPKTILPTSISSQYLLYIGTLQPRKNIVRIIEAFEFLHTKYPKLQLVLAGKIGWLADDIQHKITASSAAKKIIQLGFISDEMKVALLQHAIATVNVGLCEGFGIPVLESLLQGTPVVVGKDASLPEVAGPAGIYVDHLSSSDIARGMIQAVELTSTQRKAWQRVAAEQAKQFSWERSGQQVFDSIIRTGENT